MIFLLFLFLIPGILCCPPGDTIKPCECEWDFDTQSGDIYCSGLDNEYDLQNVAAACKNRKGLRSFNIDKSAFNYIPHDAFEGVSFKKLEIINSSLASLSDTDRALQGLEKDLSSIVIKDCTFLSQWMWVKLKHLTSLTYLELTGVELQSIYRDIEEMGSLNMTTLKFSNNEINWIYDSAFINFKKVTELRLPYNQVSVMKRQMLPRPATTLNIIDLSHNLIEQLPPDLFTDMPSLQLLTLNNNKILTLNEDTFSPIWEQLTFLEATGNDLRCDCRLSWMLRKKELYSLRAFCAEPLALKGKDLRELKAIDLWC